MLAQHRLAMRLPGAGHQAAPAQATATETGTVRGTLHPGVDPGGRWSRSKMRTLTVTVLVAGWRDLHKIQDRVGHELCLSHAGSSEFRQQCSQSAADILLYTSAVKSLRSKDIACPTWQDQSWPCDISTAQPTVLGVLVCRLSCMRAWAQRILSVCKPMYGVNQCKCSDDCNRPQARH